MISSTAVEGAPLAVILGSGLTEVPRIYPTEGLLPFDKIDAVSPPGVAGHKGELRRCIVAGRPCLFVCGRRHFYEGGAADVDHLVRFLARVGVRSLLITSAAGSLVTSSYPGELTLVDDIIDLQFRTGKHVESRGSHSSGQPAVERPDDQRFLSVDPTLKREVWAAASMGGIALGRGTAVTCAGPAYETPSEVLALQRAGATLVTMSGAPELESANLVGIRAAMVAVITNWATGISRVRLCHEEVLDVARAATRKIQQLVEILAERAESRSL